MRAALVVLCLLALLAGPAASATQRKQITVYAASSLTSVFPKIAKEKYSFGGSNSLAQQIQQGAPADVFASANTSLPQQLHENGFCSKPVVFTRNKLVIVVPKANPGHVKTIYSLTKSGVTVDIAAPGVPVGSYTQQVLKNMNLTNAVMKNVVSEESDVRDVLSKVALGEVDAGFVYSTDAKTVPHKVKVIAIPAWAQPKVRYGICVVSSSGDKADARAFIKLVLSKAGQKKLRQYGFLPR
jgi:molybdate transport system substrate-binding protein